MWVFDSTPLIHLAKVEQLAVLDNLDESWLIPAPVYKEVVKAGIEEVYPDARRIERLVGDGVFLTADVEGSNLYKQLLENDSLSRADVSVPVCADRRDGVATMDESYGRDVAAAEGIDTRGTAYLVSSSARRGVVDPERAREIIDAMVDTGWCCAPDTYAKIVRKSEAVL